MINPNYMKLLQIGYVLSFLVSIGLMFLSTDHFDVGNISIMGSSSYWLPEIFIVLPMFFEAILLYLVTDKKFIPVLLFVSAVVFWLRSVFEPVGLFLFPITALSCLRIFDIFGFVSFISFLKEQKEVKEVACVNMPRKNEKKKEVVSKEMECQKMPLWVNMLTFGVVNFFSILVSWVSDNFMMILVSVAIWFVGAFVLFRKGICQFVIAFPVLLWSVFCFIKSGAEPMASVAFLLFGLPLFIVSGILMRIAYTRDFKKKSQITSLS